ncbi:hypothetical protein RGQ29_006152 [Quercus rubra]|uniref:EF-hand domain-containing protein n=1 Tax=Quercus rubra TaxID=3512 RepID=A0AAN7IBH0_QUERU|nr:hypothetical protein RGQ29_006152 [Quercus rubra]
MTNSLSPSAPTTDLGPPPPSSEPSSGSANSISSFVEDGEVADEKDVNELGAVFSSLGSSFSNEDEDELDFDHDGFIFLIEFTAFCCSNSEDGEDSELRDAFKLYDQDKNSLISASELHLILNRLGMKCSVEDCHRMIRSVDSDGDRNVNFEEF